ncbi:MAG: hypothetical protein AAF368_09050, partial [Planctomycetota bacterium]
VEVTDASGSVAAWGSGFLGPSGFVAGQQRIFQAVYREDVNAGCGTGLNTTQAVSVVLVP